MFSWNKKQSSMILLVFFYGSLKSAEMAALSEGIYPRSTAPSSRAVELIVVSSIFTALAVLFCGMRLYTRKVLLKIGGVDDWIVTIATVWGLSGLVRELRLTRKRSSVYAKPLLILSVTVIRVT
jgi:hypothetical protein